MPGRWSYWYPCGLLKIEQSERVVHLLRPRFHAHSPLSLPLSLAPPAKNVFRVSSLDPSHGQSHTLQVNDVYHKQQWLNCLRGAMALQPAGAPRVRAETAGPVSTRRRSSTVSLYNEEVDENNCPDVVVPSQSKTRLEKRFRGSLRRKETGV